MLLDMTISNFRSVQNPQTISFEAVRDNRLDASKVVEITERLKVIKSLAIIGPNGAGKSTFVRALEALRAILMADEEMENPLQLLAGTAFAYSTIKGGPAEMIVELVLGTDKESGQALRGKYTFIADREKIYEESYHVFVGPSRKLMFERKLKASGNDEVAYSYRWGKMFRGDKKRLIDKVSCKHSYLAAAARKGSSTAEPVYKWFAEELMILPFGLSPISEKTIVEQLQKHPSWKKQLIDFLWSIDITDIRDIRFNEDRLIFVHTNVSQHYASYFSNESLSLRRLTSIAVAMFESFVSKRCLVIDDFGMLLHPYALEHIVEVFEASNHKFSSQLFAVDCNPALLKYGILRRDAIWFAQKNAVSATEYFSLADFKFSKAKRDLTGQLYLNGSYGALPITSEYTFIDDEKGEQ